jgi:hypothetical protein
MSQLRDINALANEEKPSCPIAWLSIINIIIIIDRTFFITA